MSSVVQRWWGCVLAGVVLLAGGWGYRLTAAAINAELEAPIRLDPPLSSLPLVLGSWQGEDVPIRESVQKIAMNDDYVNRHYRNAETGAAVNLYIGYTARPRTMLRHRPTVCYPSAGWSHLGTHAVEIPLRGTPPSSSGSRSSLPALLHTFMRSGADELRTVVLNYYVLSGRVTVDENSFWGLQWRDPNLGQDAGRYVAQVQIAVPALSGTEAAERMAQAFAADAAGAILALLPGPGNSAEPSPGP